MILFFWNSELADKQMLKYFFFIISFNNLLNLILKLNLYAFHDIKILNFSVDPWHQIWLIIGG